MVKILVIDDEFYLRKMTAKILEYSGYQIISAEDGNEGIEIAKNEIPDLIISDISMPNKNGYEVLQELKKEQKTALIPFIFLSAKSEPTDLRNGMDLGADDYLTKPFESKQLLKAVEARLEKAKKLQSYSYGKLEELRSSISQSLPHEVFTPLNSVLGLSSMIQNYNENMEKEDIVKMCETINDSANRLYGTLKNFVYYANLQIINSNPERRAAYTEGIIDNPKFLIETEAMRLATTYKRESDLILDLQDSSIKIRPDTFLKIVSETLSNSFKFSEGGTEVKVSTYIEDKFYVIKILDNGRGMTQDQLSNIQAYFQFDRNVYEQQGSGLGLAITKLLIEIFQGEMFFESKPSEHTLVVIKLPL